MTIWRNRLAFCLTCFFTSQISAANPQDVSQFQVAAGLQIEAFATEPLLINPTAMDIDPAGRVWVTEAVNYRRIKFNRPILRPEGDRIVILIDANQDGKAEEAKVFYQGRELYGPLGIAVVPTLTKGYRVFVTQSPDILVFEDANGDLKADGPPKKLLTNIEGYDHDHGVHGILVGPDGKLYFTVGDQGVKGLQSADGKGRKWDSNQTDCRAGTVWRCNQDGTQLELIAHNFRNNYEAAVNSYGEIFLSDNDDDGNQQTRICHVIRGGNYGYFPRGQGQSHWHEEQPGIVHKVIRTFFGSPTGIAYYEGNLLPERFHGQLLHTDAGPRELRCFHLKSKGAGYEAEKEVLVTSSDTMFRPSDVAVAPDGSVFIADWYDPGVGGHGMGDWTKGRIYRVTPKGHAKYSVAEPNVETDQGILESLRSPALSARALAIVKLQSLSVEARTAFVRSALKTVQDPILKARLTWFVPENDNEFSPLATLQHASASNEAKQQAVRRIAGNKEATSQLAEIIVSQSAAVQREFLTQCYHDFDPTKDATLKSAWYELAKRYSGGDHFYRAALFIAAESAGKNRDVLLADFGSQFTQWNSAVSELVWELRPKSMLPKLTEYLADASFDAKQKPGIIDILAVADDAETPKMLLGLLHDKTSPEVRSKILQNLQTFLPHRWSNLKNSKELAERIRQLMAATTTIPDGLTLLAAAGRVEDASLAVQVLSQEKTPIEVKKLAIATIGKLNSSTSFHALKQEIQKETPLAADAIAAIASLIPARQNTPVGEQSLVLLKSLIENPKAKPELARAALWTLSGTRPGSQWLIDHQTGGKLPSDFVADAGRLLRNSPFQDLRNKAMLAFPAPGKLDPKRLPPSSVLATRTGNASNGKTILAKSLTGETQCLKCHMVNAIGGRIGPDLSMIGKKGSKENLYDSILQPSKAIADQYLQWQISTSDGQQISGLLQTESEDSIVIRDANGKDYRIAKKDVEDRRKSQVSLMPDNLVVAMTEEELVDLVEYLMNLQSNTLAFDQWKHLGPFENTKGIDEPTSFESNKVVNGSPEFTGKSGKISWKVVQPNQVGYLDLAAILGPNSNNAVSYLYREIESTRDQEATLLIGNDDEIRVWLNDQDVVSNREHLAASPERMKQTVKLKKGTNKLLIKITNGNNPHGLYFSIRSEEELKLLPIK